MSQMRQGMIPFITEDEINDLTTQLAQEIETEYHGQPLVLICPLKGSVIFFSDIVRKIRAPMEVDFVHVTSPKGEGCRILKDLDIDITGKHVVIIEEIIDAGRTLNFLKTRLAASFPASLKVCALLDKPSRREIPLTPDFVGKTIDDRFVIGYGMDSEEVGRNYKDIYNYAQ